MKTPFSLAFTAIISFLAAAAGAVELGWTSGPMASDGSTIRTDGTLLYAYAVQGGAVGGVTFARATDFANAVMVSASPTSAGYVFADFMNEGVSGDFGHMLEGGWYWGYNGAASGELSFVLTLKGLTAGRTYLLQLVSHRHSRSTLVSANGSTPVHIYGTYDGVDYTYGGSIVGIFEATDTTANFTVTYSVNSSGMRPLNAIQVRDLGESGGGGGGDPVDPVDPDDPGDPAETPIYTLTIPAKTGLTLGSVTTNGVAVSVANNACSIVSNTTVTINFTAASGYDIVSGNPVIVTVTANKTLADGEYPVVQEQGGSGGGGDEPGPTPGDGWTATPMGATSASIRTDGTLLYAYARGNYTVNGVSFVSEGTDGIDNANCTVNITHEASCSPPDDTEEGGYKNLLGKGWYASAANRTVALKNLEAGKRYLVQIIAFRSDFTTQSATAPDGMAVIKFGGTGWEYGGSLIGIFTASGTTKDFIVTYAGNSWLNAIQVRELPADEPASSRGLIFICK